MVYRVKQFFKSITAKTTEDEEMWVKKVLNGQQQKLFFSLPIYEQRHSIDVAKSIMKKAGQLNKDEYNLLIKAALLHDIGKVNTGLNPITKSIAVIYDCFNSRKKIPSKPKFLQAYYLHPDLGVEFLQRDGDANKTLLFLISNHHQPIDKVSNELLKLLIECDEEN
ncbi:HD domain-containing protein [Proteinivorax tanatarense]|uniref:HD domain-containing protein n=1 Tax=Proteinivorax tanatarense TaxID=1260629 RepID=A0AAU7VN17_9FIRM